MTITRLAGAGIISLFLSAQVLASPYVSSVCKDCKPVKVATCGGFLEGPTVDEKGRLWVVDVIGGRLLEISNGKCIEKLKTGGHPNSALATQDGKILIADWSGLLSYDAESGKVTNEGVTFNGEKLSGLNDLALDKHGGLYFTVPGRSDALQPNGQVFYRDTAGVINMISDRFAYPNGIAVTNDGEAVIVADFAAKRIISVPAVGAKGPIKTAYVFALTQGGVGVDGMKIDNKGRLYAANLAARQILIYGPDAILLGAIELPAEAGSLVTNLTINHNALYITEAGKGEVWKVDLAGTVGH